MGVNIFRKALTIGLVGGFVLCGCVAKTIPPTQISTLTHTYTFNPNPAPTYSTILTPTATPTNTPVPIDELIPTDPECGIAEYVIQSGDTAYDICGNSCIDRKTCIESVGRQVRSGDPNLIRVGEIVRLYFPKGIAPTPIPKPTSTPQTIELSPLESALLKEINELRAPLILSTDLYRVAKQRIEGMVSTGNFSHDTNRNDEPDVFEVMEQIGLCQRDNCYGGELLVRMPTKVEGKEFSVEEIADLVVYGFLTSKLGHREILLNGRYKEIGLYGKFNEIDNRIYVAVILGL